MNQFALARAKLKNFRFKPNQTELGLIEFLEEEFPGKFIFNGGQLMICGLVPDFFCAKHQAILEYIGRRDLPKHEPEYLEEREKIFAKFGFRTMYIYQENLKDKYQLSLDILFFLHYDIKGSESCQPIS